MKLHTRERCLFGAVILLLLGLSLVNTKITQGYYGCGEGPCKTGVFHCNSPLMCSKSRICGQLFNQCNGASCVASGGWNQTTCNSVSCTIPGNTRTASFGACTASCGAGTKTCNCSAANGCSVTCDGGVACGVTTTACCTDQLPQAAPTISSVGTGACSKNDPMTVNWSFSDTGSTCGTSWGYKCTGNTNTFSIKVDGVNNTTNIPSTDRTAIISASVAATLQIQVCANNGFGENCSAAYAVTIDNSAPLKPPGTNVSFNPDPVCIDKYIATYSWNATTDEECAGLNSTPYWAQGSSISDFSSVLPGWNNTWANNLSQTTSTSYVPGTTLYFQVQSRDALDNQSGWSTTETAVAPMPSLYPTIHVAGPLVEDINGVCSPMSLMSNFTLEPIIVPALGVTPVCTMPTTSSYSCNITIDNQKGSCTSPNIQVTMNGTYSGYGSIGWRSGAGEGECSGLPTSKSYSVGDTSNSTPLYLSYNNVSIGGAGGWFKLSNTSFNSRQANRINYIPYNVQKYDSEDEVSRTVLSGNSGLLLQGGPVQSGANAYQDGKVVYSTNNWYTDEYTSINDMTYLKYIDYIKARKEYMKIESPITSDSFPTSGIYSISENITLNSTWFDGKNVVLVIEGGKTATFTTDFIPPNNGSVAVVAPKIDIDSLVTEIDAILIGQTVTTGDSETIGLKIKGNLIDENPSGLILGRSRANGSYPSLFVVFDPRIYLNILPYLSTSTYDWKQIQ